jgi:hypothetical protein
MWVSQARWKDRSFTFHVSVRGKNCSELAHIETQFLQAIAKGYRITAWIFTHRFICIDMIKVQTRTRMVIGRSILSWLLWEINFEKTNPLYLKGANYRCQQRSEWGNSMRDLLRQATAWRRLVLYASRLYIWCFCKTTYTADIYPPLSIPMLKRKFVR